MRIPSLSNACKALALATVLVSLGGCGAVEVRTVFDSTGAGVALWIDYAAAGAVLGGLAGRQAPDFTLPLPDADTLGGLSK